MDILRRLWKRLSLCQEVRTSGEFEKAFLESVYRICYAAGLAKFNQSTGYKIYSSTILLGLLMFFCSVTLYPVLVDLTLLEMISSCNLLILYCMTAWKFLSMTRHKSIYKKIEKSMESPYFDISTERRKKLFDYWKDKHSVYLTMLLRLRTYNLTVWNISPLLDDEEYNLPLDLYIPFDYYSNIKYISMYILVVICITYASYWVIMSEAVIQAHLYPLICQYAVLADCFENIIEDCAGCPDYERDNFEQLCNNKEFTDKYIKRLGDLVQQHTHILKNSLSMKTALSTPMLGQLAATGLLLCMTTYQATATITDNKGKFVVSLLYLGYNMYTFYHVCKSCEEITIQSENIGRAVYFSGWEAGMVKVPGVRCTAMMIIARSNKPLIFLAGGMYPLSLISYANLVKTSYSAFTMLLKTNKQN